MNFRKYWQKPNFGGARAVRPPPVVRAVEPMIVSKTIVQQAPKIVAPAAVLQIPQDPLIVPKQVIENIPKVAQPARPIIAVVSPPQMAPQAVKPAPFIVPKAQAELPPINAKFVQTIPDDPQLPPGAQTFAPAPEESGSAAPSTQDEDTGPTIFNDQYETAEGDERDEDGEIMDNDSGFNADVPIVASHISNGTFRTIAIVHTPMGCFPITAALPLKGARDGFVNMNGEVFKRAILGVKRAILSKKATVGKELVAENLINRSRQGDQNAMAIIVGVRENAKAGDPNAKQSFAILKKTIAENPIDSTMGAEEKRLKNVMGTAMMLANGPPITNARMHKFISSFGNEARTAHYAIKHSAQRNPRKVGNNSVRQSALDMGRAMGIAQRIQSVRMPGASISKFDPRIGWELGE